MFFFFCLFVLVFSFKYASYRPTTILTTAHTIYNVHSKLFWAAAGSDSTNKHTYINMCICLSGRRKILRLHVSNDQLWDWFVFTEFSETPNPAYFYAYFCFCTRKISFRGFSFTLDCHRTSKLNFKDVPRTSEISFVRRNRYPRCPKNCQKARPLLYDVCPAYLLEIRYLCWLSFKDVPLSACGSFIDIGVKRRGTLLMAA